MVRKAPWKVSRKTGNCCFLKIEPFNRKFRKFQEESQNGKKISGKKRAKIPLYPARLSSFPNIPKMLFHSSLEIFGNWNWNFSSGKCAIFPSFKNKQRIAKFTWLSKALSPRTRMTFVSSFGGVSQTTVISARADYYNWKLPEFTAAWNNRRKISLLSGTWIILPALGRTVETEVNTQNCNRGESDTSAIGRSRWALSLSTEAHARQ